MEGFYNFDSEMDIKLPTHTELKEIKQMLLTGDRNKILLSVEKIKKFLNSEKSVSEILRSDILEFLCDALLPFDSIVACTLYQCIEIMITHIEFFIHNHSCFAIESLMRSLHFIMMDCDNFKGLNQCLKLLNLILQGYNSHSVIPEKKTIENLIQMLSILKNLSPTINNKYQTGVFILNLIELNILKWSEQACDIILTNLSSWLILMSEILECEHPMKEDLILLCCTLCHSTLRFILSSKNLVEEFTFEINENLKNDIIKNITDFLITIGAPYFDSLCLNKIENNPTDLENFYQTILWLCNDEITTQNCLVHGLSETNFLQFTTKIIIGVSQKKLQRLCILVLFYMVLYLAEDVFNLPEIWPSGCDDFRCVVQHGIAELPTNAAQWLEVLIRPHATFSSKLALLLYLYFYSMTAKSQDMLQAIYPTVVNFISFNNEIGSSVLLLKVVWFVFVMCQLSVARNSSLEIDFEDTNKMVALLETHQDLSLVYTHHPALLYWAFSSKVSSNIQIQTVYCWLKNKTPDCKELDELMRHSSDARYAILDILQNGWGEELDSAFSYLKSLLLDINTNEDLADSIWFLLPQVLAKFTADLISVSIVDYVIELSSLKTPKNLEITKIIRVASLLPEVFLKSDLISIIPSLSLVFQLVRLGRQMEDNRVVLVFLRHDGFIQKIIEGLNTNVSQIFTLSIKIMAVFWKESQDVKQHKKLEINPDAILKIFNTDFGETLMESLNFLQEILITNFNSPVFEIRVDSSFLENLCLEIQNACIKMTPEQSERCWQCLKLLILLESELMTNPLLNELILFNLPYLNDSLNFKEFLIVWMDFYNLKINHPCFGRKIFGEFYTETVMRIGRELKRGDKEEDGILFKKVQQSGFFYHDYMGE